MNTFKTPSGLELPMSDVKGQPYLKVPQRIQWFRHEHPDWTIKTTSVELTDKESVFRAEISNPEGRLIQTGHGHESLNDFQDHLEKAETKAIGRALANAGYGTQFALELDEGSRLADSPVIKSGSALALTEKLKLKKLDEQPLKPLHQEGEYVIRFGKFSNKTLKEVPLHSLESYKSYLEDTAQSSGKPLGAMALEFIQELKEFKQQPEPSVHGDDQLPF